MANKITKLSLYTLALVALIAHLLDMSLFENRVFSFEKSLPFTQIITLYLNSSQYNFKIFYAILITTAVFTFRAKFLAPKVLICLPLTAKISYLPLAYYSNESLLKDVVNNELLQNNLNSIHPVLVYLIFAIALTFTAYQKKNKNTHILNKTNYVQIPLASFTLILGSW